MSVKQVVPISALTTSNTSLPKPAMSAPLTDFPLFPKLPLELQRLIWYHAIEPRFISIVKKSCTRLNALAKEKIYSPSPIPLLLQTCRESRKALINSGYTPSFGSLYQPAQTWFSPHHDIIFVQKVHVNDFIQHHQEVPFIPAPKTAQPALVPIFYPPPQPPNLYPTALHTQPPPPPNLGGPYHFPLHHFPSPISHSIKDICIQTPRFARHWYFGTSHDKPTQEILQILKHFPKLITLYLAETVHGEIEDGQCGWGNRRSDMLFDERGREEEVGYLECEDEDAVEAGEGLGDCNDLRKLYEGSVRRFRWRNRNKRGKEGRFFDKVKQSILRKLRRAMDEEGLVEGAEFSVPEIVLIQVMKRSQAVKLLRGRREYWAELERKAVEEAVVDGWICEEWEREYQDDFEAMEEDFIERRFGDGWNETRSYAVEGVFIG